MTVLQRPRDGSGPGYNPFLESVIKLFPESVVVAIDSATNKELGVREQLIKIGATEEGLDAAVKFYDNYLDLLIQSEASEDAIETFKKADIHAGDLSFQLFQGLVTASVITAYHKAVCEVSQLEPIWCKSNIHLVQKYMADAVPDLCPKAVARTTQVKQAELNNQQQS